MESSTRLVTSELWAITSYFNPIGYKRRLRNYFLFREKLNIPLVTVELGYNGTFELRSGDADILIQLLGRDVLWQKERLLNIALRHVPGYCSKIAWLDCDILFETPTWHELAIERLNAFPILQLFDRAYDLSSVSSPDLHISPPFSHPRHSLAYKFVQRTAEDADFRETPRLPNDRELGLFGLAWAGKRSILEGHGFYDACILGSGVRAMGCAALGRFDDVAVYLQMNKSQVAHFLTWAIPFSKTVRGNLGFVPGTIYHLWHGDIRNRKYAERHLQFKHFNFNPFEDIAIDRNSCWRWNTNKVEMHQFVRHYFESRIEDAP